MNCCTPTIVPFNNVPSTVIGYSAAMVDKYGSKPNVQVYYREGSEFVLSDDMNSVKFDGSNIFVDHGGNMYGFVKIF